MMLELLLRRLDAEIDESECGAVKRLYLQRSTSSSVDPNNNDTANASDDDCNNNNGNLSSLLRVCRIVVADRRALWEHLSPSLVDAFGRPVDLWNEQLAVKLLWTHLSQIASDTAEKKEFVSGLRDAVSRYMSLVLKPAGGVAETTFCAAPADDLRQPFVIRSAADGVAGHVEGSLLCAAPLPVFADLLRVARDRMFYVDTVSQHSALGRAVHSSAALRDALSTEEPLLVVALIYERFVAGPAASHWRVLLESCPSEYPTVPSFWSWEDIAELDGLDVLDDVLSKRAQLTQFHEEILALLPHIHAAMGDSCPLALTEFLGGFTFEALCWARATFDSRAFNLNIDGRVVLALVPVADMINHGNRADVLVRKVEADNGDFVMQIGAPLTAADVGRELWMSYGPLQNWELLQFYGFLLEDNEHDKLPFPFPLPADEDGDDADLDVWDRRRLALVKTHALHIAGRCWIGRDGVPPPALCALLRIHLAEADEFGALERGGPFAPVGNSTERRVVATIAETVGCILELSGTSLEEDEQSLRRGGPEALTLNRRLAISLRVALKQIAQRTLKWCATAMAVHNKESNYNSNEKEKEDI